MPLITLKKDLQKKKESAQKNPQKDIQKKSAQTTTTSVAQNKQNEKTTLPKEKQSAYPILKQAEHKTPLPQKTSSPQKRTETSAAGVRTRTGIKKEFTRRATSASPMIKIIEETKNPPRAGDLVDGPVIDIEKSSLYVDLVPFGTGTIYGREFINARDIIKKINIGDTITAKVVERENDNGYIELSLKEARQALIWSEAEEAINSKKAFDLSVKDANKGGLILEWRGIPGFLPASQLKPEHYPRVEDGSKEKILTELKKLNGEKLTVSIISTDPKEGKLIFSEKEPGQKEKNGLEEKYSVGDILDGEITGIVDFGLFIKIEEGLEGLVHISEMDWGLVEDPRALFKVGEKVKAQIIELKDGKISLSVKALKENPWAGASKKYKKGDLVKGVIIKYNKYGALVSIEEGIAGLVHVSEFGNDEKLKEVLELGKTYPFTITFFEPENQRMTFSYQKKQEEKAPNKAT